MFDNPIPELVTKAQVDEALRVLGITAKGIGLVSVHIGLHSVVVTRNIKDGGRLVRAGVESVLPIDLAERDPITGTHEQCGATCMQSPAWMQAQRRYL